MSFQVDIYNGSLLTSGSGTPSLLATMDRCWGAGFQKLLNESGSGTFKISRYDANLAYVTKGNLVRMKINGSYVFDWIIETVETVQAAVDPGQEIITVSGRGLLAYFDRAIIYPDGWPGSTSVNVTRNAQALGTMMANFLTDAKNRGAIPAAHWDFTTSLDSSGAAWVDSQSQQFRVGVNYLDLLRQFTTLGIDLSCSYSSTPSPGVWLHLWKALGTSWTSGPSAVVFQQGKDFGYASDGGNTDLSLFVEDGPVRSRMLVEGSNGLISETVSTPLETDATIGRREGYLSYPTGVAAADLNAAGQVSLTVLNAESKPIQATVLHGANPFYEPFSNYDVGDTVVIDAAPTF